jgi:hypothetical protein
VPRLLIAVSASGGNIGFAKASWNPITGVGTQPEASADAQLEEAFVAGSTISSQTVDLPRFRKISI